jgi:hypothetical protein
MKKNHVVMSFMFYDIHQLFLGLPNQERKDKNAVYIVRMGTVQEKYINNLVGRSERGDRLGGMRR